MTKTTRTVTVCEKLTGQRYDAWHYDGPASAPAAAEGTTVNEYPHLTWRLCLGQRSTTFCVPSLRVLDYWVRLQPGDWYVRMPSGLGPVTADQFEQTFSIFNPDAPDAVPWVSPPGAVAGPASLTKSDADLVIQVTWTDLRYSVMLLVDEDRHIVSFELSLVEGTDRKGPIHGTGVLTTECAEFHPCKSVPNQDLEAYALAWSRAIRTAKRAWKDTIE